MTNDLVDMLQLAQSQFPGRWAELIERMRQPIFPSTREGLVNFGSTLIEELGHYLGSGNPDSLRSCAANLAKAWAREDIPLSRGIHLFTTLRDVIMDLLETNADDQDRLYRASLWLSGAIGLALIEFAKQYEVIYGQHSPPRPPQVQELLAAEIQRSVRFQRPISVFLGCVDGYEEYMRLYGSYVAEAAVKAVQEVLSRLTREIDIKVPLDGGGFVVILPETAVENAFWVAERLRAAVNTWQSEGEGSLFVFTLTISIGLVQFPLDGEEAAKLLQLAQELLESARLMGGNTVMAHQRLALAQGAFGSS